MIHSLYFLVLLVFPYLTEPNVILVVRLLKLPSAYLHFQKSRLIPSTN